MGKEALMWEQADWNDRPPALTWSWENGPSRVSGLSLFCPPYLLFLI